MSSVGLIGFGRFGKIMGNILSTDFTVKVFDRDINECSEDNIEVASLESVSAETTIFISVPIRDFKSIIMEIAEMVHPGTTILDVCSVKVYPATVMTETLPENIGIINTHPLFGPDSYQLMDNLKIMMHPTRDINKVFNQWEDYFISKKIAPVEMTPEEHDQIAANSQGITHFLGRTLKNAGIENTSIDTLGFTDLLGVIEQTCNDSWELFHDLQNYNPYTMEMISKIKKSIDNIRNDILRRD